METNLEGKTIKGGSIGLYDRLEFTDGSSVSLEMDYSSCYYEGDSPSVAVIYHPSTTELNKAAMEVQHWFKAHPTQKTRTFRFWDRDVRFIRGQKYRLKLVEMFK